MIDKKVLVEFYRDQYRQETEGRRSKNLKMKDLESRTMRLHRTLHNIRPDRMRYQDLTDAHKQVRNLLLYAQMKRRDGIVKILYGEMIPDLVRLDVGFLMEEQREGVDDVFLDYLKENCSGEICYKPLFVLYPAYKEKIIREQMTELVPVRPELEFPDTLAMKRHFIIHVGPTNSGKTYQALSRLREAEQGIYLGPLRLLALEVYEKMHDEGIPSAMLTGQEQIVDEGARIVAATVEMADLDRHFDVAVIDEAQLMADKDRGHSWTRAILGLKADEIHICASPAGEKALIHMIGICHDTYEIRRYERKTELVFEQEPFMFPDDVQQGDALIVFSKKSVLDVSGRLEAEGIECSVIYGSLPPEIRRRQMHLFTSGKTKVVVSTDAIGMGLNLPVRRIIFLQVSKYDGREQRLLETSEIRQIAGRAGRFGIYDTGYISAADEESLDYIKRTYEEFDPPVETVNLGFPQVLLDIDEPLDEILKVWHDQQPEPPFEKENIDEALFLYEKAYEAKPYIVGFDDKRLLYSMISCPIDIKDRRVVSLWQTYCMTYTADVSLRKPAPDRREKNELLRYETYYRQLDLYYQMSSRLGKILDEEWIRKEREKTEEKIMHYLLKGKSKYIKRCETCGRLLPIDYPFRYCERCYGSGAMYRRRRSD